MNAAAGSFHLHAVPLWPRDRLTCRGGSAQDSSANPARQDNSKSPEGRLIVGPPRQNGKTTAATAAGLGRPDHPNRASLPVLGTPPTCKYLSIMVSEGPQ